MALAVATWAVLPPYVGPRLALARRVEIADHVVPAAVLVVLAIAALALARRGQPAGTFLFVAGLVIMLAGIWMTATHVPLLAQSRRGEVTTAAALNHTVPGLVVLGLGVAWTAVHWGDAEPGGGEPGGGDGRG